MRFLSHSLAETEAAAIRFLNQLAPERARATVVALVGDLGSGKTAFVQALARQLGIEGVVTSPTFVLQKVYPARGGVYPFTRLVHIDAYRLSHPEELVRLRFAETLAEPGSLVAIEWAERVASFLPAGHATLNFKFIDDQTREISLA